jgi:transposase
VFGLGLATKIYIAVEAVDMRKGFEGLYGLVRDELGADPLSGHLFLFSNRTRTRLKALAGSRGQAQRDDACGRVGDAGKRFGCEANAAAQVVSQERIKMSRVLLEAPVQ